MLLAVVTSKASIERLSHYRDPPRSYSSNFMGVQRRERRAARNIHCYTPHLSCENEMRRSKAGYKRRDLILSPGRYLSHL